MLRSAVANAEANPRLHWNGDDLVVEAAYVDEGPTLKRWRAARPRPRRPDHKRTCHITIELAPSDCRRRRRSRAARPRAAAAEPATEAAELRPRAPSSSREPEQSRSRVAARRRRRRWQLMGQKVHPGGLRVGVIHDWKSNWYAGKKEFPQYMLEDVKIREHINDEARPRRAVRHPDPQGQAADHGRHLHRAPRAS